MRNVTNLLVASALLAAGASSVSAQVIERPPRSTERAPRTTGGLFGGRRPADPNRTSQELTLTVDFLGGYEDNLSPGGDQATPDFSAPRLSGATGVLSGGVSYKRGRLTRGFEATARSVVAGYQNVGVRPMIGGRGSVRAFAELFDELTITSWGEIDYRPTFMFGSAATPGSDAVPPPDPTGGVAEVRSLNTSGGISLSQSWNVRHNTNGTYTYSRMRSTGLGELEVDDHSATVGHSWNFLRNVGLQGSVGASRQSAGNVTVGARPLEMVMGSLGL